MSVIKLTPQTKTFLLGLSVSVLILASFFAGALADRIFVIRPLDYFAQRGAGSAVQTALSTLLPGDTTRSSSVADVAELSSRSVVTIAIRQEQRQVNTTNDIFGFQFQTPTGQVLQVQRDIGTGFVANGEGLIVTNRHVVSDPSVEYLVIDKDDQEYQVADIYRDPSSDLAILRVEGTKLPGLVLGDSDRLRVGESVIAIGTALGEFRHTVTTGVVSGLGRGVQAIASGRSIESLEGVIQTDAAINPGNSGGPLLNAQGEVIGVNVAISAGAENIGFAIPINVVKASIDNFNQTGQFERAYFGVRYQMISEESAVFNDVPQGAYVVEVVSGSTADEIGLQPDDIITHFDNQRLTESSDLAAMINTKNIGDQVTVMYWRDGEQQEVTVTLRSGGQE